MSESYSILAQTSPGAATLVDSYVVPASTQTVNSTIVVANRSAAATAFRISVAAAGAADATKQYLAYDVPISGNETKTFTLGVTLNATDVVRVYNTLATLSFNVFGAEIIAATGTTARIFTSSTVLADAQIKALPTTPITLVAAPASGSRVKLLAVTYHLNNNAGAYTNINVTFCAFGQITAAGGSSWLAIPAFINDNTLTTPLAQVTNNLGGTGSRVIDLLVGAPTSIDAGAVSGATEWTLENTFPLASELDGAAVVISADNNGSGNFMGGNAANTLRVTLYYMVEVL